MRVAFAHPSVRINAPGLAASGIATFVAVAALPAKTRPVELSLRVQSGQQTGPSGHDQARSESPRAPGDTPRRGRLHVGRSTEHPIRLARHGYLHCL